MPKFRNISPDARHVGTTDGLLLQPEQLYSVDGELFHEDDEAYYVGSGDDNLRAFAKSTWKLEGKVLDKPAKSASKADWAAYATSRGTTAADELTKDELVAKYDTDDSDDSEGGE